MKDMSEKIILEWGKAAINKPASQKEIENTLLEMKKRSSKSNVFQLSGLSAGMVEYLKDHLDPDNAIMKTVMEPERPNGGYWVMIGADEKTVDAEISRI